MNVDAGFFEEMRNLVAEVVREELEAEHERRKARMAEIMDSAGLPDPPPPLARPRRGLRVVE